MKAFRNTLLFMMTALPMTASSLSIVARADSPSVLPGIPVSLILTVENTGDVPQTVPGRAVLLVRPESGQPFIPDEVGLPVQMFPEEYRDARVLQAGEKRHYEIPLADALTGGIMADSRLWQPGLYHLQIFLHDDLRSNDVRKFGVDGLHGAGRISSPLLVSSPAPLRIEKPEGVNGEIWTTILKATDGRGLLRNPERDSHAIARDLWDRAADSPYQPYLLVYLRYASRAELREKWNGIVKRDPEHRVAETIRLGDARTKARDAESAMTRSRDLETALARTEEARAELSVLAQDARHDLVRVLAAKELAKLKSRERLIEMYRELVPKQ